jgi:hypothetical protein
MPGSAPTRPRRFPWWIYWLVLTVLIVISWLPLASAFYSEHLARTYDCPLNETVTVCIDDKGNDIGQWLYELQVYPYMMIFTVPIGFGLGFIWLIVLIAHCIVFNRSKAEAPLS